MNATLTFAALALYGAATILLIRRLSRGAAAGSASKFPPLGLGLAGAAIHAVQVQAAVFTPTGMDLSFFSVASLIAWLVSLLVLLAALVRSVENIAIVTLPLAAVADLLRMIVPAEGAIVTDAGPGIEAHITLSLLAYSVLTIAAVQAVLVAVQDRQLRNRHPGGFIRALPPLETMEATLFDLIGVGFALLSLALLSGTLFLEDIFAQHLVHKTVLSVSAWLVFATLLWGRGRFGWRGRPAIRWTLGGFATLMVAYFGSKLVMEVILRG